MLDYKYVPDRSYSGERLPLSPNRIDFHISVVSILIRRR